MCDWAYNPDASTGNFHVTGTVTAKNVVFRVLESYPPTRPFSIALDLFHARLWRLGGH